MRGHFLCVIDTIASMLTDQRQQLVQHPQGTLSARDAQREVERKGHEQLQAVKGRVETRDPQGVGEKYV